MFETANPKQPFLVANQIELFPQDQEILIKLYQPLVGAIAVAFYQTLIQDYDPYEILSDARGIYALQEQLDCSLKDFFQALHKLEGVGLVQTFLVDNEVTKVLVFRLLKVQTAQEFFSTALLASLLKEKVGESDFHRLSHYFAKKAKMTQKQVKNARDISASFLEVFSLPDDEAISPSTDVLEAANENQVADVGRAQLNQDDHINWGFLKQQFTMYQVNPNEVEQHKSQIRNLMKTYGLNEQEFVDESLPSLHGSNQLDMKAIARLIAENYRAIHARRDLQQEIEQNRPHNVQMPRGLSQEKQQLLQAANSKSPAQFLYEIKKEKGGYASADEKRIIYNLRNQRGLPSDLINVLIYACLKYSPVLTNRLADRIANDWLQHKVTTSKDAIDHIDEWDKRALNRTKQRYQPQKRVEKGTDWSKKKATVDKSVNSEDLKNFFKNLEDQSGMK
ncbi:MULTISPECIES: DnaD domain protein [Lactobacillus]|uniref:Chromosome replication initiation protein n=1 Tax=Lactobacillus xujianguonis TaxID=2495899 RepID=A0A437SUG8_9LACO|nr:MULTISPECIES: DnaD domain protein [Lactobacillus]RVU70565.1 chromosome replication initiation protein [Lactobacillus xujianguonis]RVU73810.1 chromosome replication initiation protein [Lactobacillus xujianguonis]